MLNTILKSASAALAGSAIWLLCAAPAMASCSVTYTFSNGSTADAGQVNQDFTDVLGCVGSPTFSGNVTTTGGYFYANTSTGTAGLFTATGPGVNDVSIILGTSLSSSFIAFYTASSIAGAINPVTSSSLQYLTTSDERLKNFEVPQHDYRPVIENLLIRDFVWRKDGYKDFGVSAQQAYPLYPFAIHKPSESNGTWQADYGRFAPLALWGVKDLYKITTAQSTDVAAIKMRANQLTDTISKLQRVNDVQAGEIRLLQTQMVQLRRKVGIQTAQN